MTQNDVKLRRVTFSLSQEQFYPDEQEQDRMKELTKKREGYFHCLTNIEEQSPQSGNFREKTVALVEDAQTGKLHHVDIDLIVFNK